MPVLFNGSNTILTSSAGSTAAVGDWYSVAGLTELSFQAILTASSVGATAGTTVHIEVSNTTAIALATKGRTIGLTCTTDTVSDGGSLVSSMVGTWRYIRANLASLTTSTAGSAGSPSVTVRVGARAIR